MDKPTITVTPLTPAEMQHLVQEICEGYERAFKLVAANADNLARISDEIEKTGISDAEAGYIYDALQLVMKQTTGMDF